MILRKRIFIGLIAIFLIIIAGIPLISRERKGPYGSNLTPSQEMKELRIITRSGNATEWIVTARNAEMVDNNARLKDVRFVSTSKNIKIESPECIYNIDTGEAFFNEDLNIIMNNGIKAKLKNVSIKNNLLESHSPVRIEKGNAIITGNRIKKEGEKIEISGNVKMIIR